jgi:hypothetical protein
VSDLAPLEAVRHVAAEYGIPSPQLKPCVALLLDGNLTGDRHKAAFVIAIECRRIGFDEERTARVLRRWAKKIGYPQRAACRAILNAFAREGEGWRYHPPGLAKKPGTIYAELLVPTCELIGCPANCAPLSGIYRGPRSEGFARFEQLGWPGYLRRSRRASDVDWYRAICEVERERGIAPGGLLFVSYKQLARIAGRDHSKSGQGMHRLASDGLLREFLPGGGSGPHARDRRASRVARLVPIPPLPMAAITTGGERPPQIGGERPLKDLGGERQPDIGGAPERETG